MLRRPVTAVALVAALGFGPMLEARGPRIHSVTGAGHVSESGIEFWQAVAVNQAADGSLRGAVAVVIDLRVFELGHIALNSTPTCLVVAGDSAWIGSTVVQSTNTDIFPIGSELITLVRDLGGEGEDVLHGEAADFFPPGTTCADMPALPESVVNSGNLHVQ